MENAEVRAQERGFPDWTTFIFLCKRGRLLPKNGNFDVRTARMIENGEAREPSKAPLAPADDLTTMAVFAIVVFFAPGFALLNF